MTASHLLALCFVLTAYGTDLGPPLGFCSAYSPTNVSAYPTTQSTPKSVVDLIGSTDRSVSPGRRLNYLQGDSTPHVQLATTPRSPPLFIDSIDVERDPKKNTDHAVPAPATRSSHDKPIPVGNSFRPALSHRTDTSGMKDFLKRPTTGDDGPKKDAQPRILTPGQKHIWTIFTKKNVLAKICGHGPELFYTMTRTQPITPPQPPLSLCFELLYFIALFSISALLVVSTACAFGFAKRFGKLTDLKIPCRELLLVFLTLFPAPGAAAAQGLANHHNSSIQVVVHTNANASTSMVAVDTVTSWAQLVTMCATPSANITLSPAFKMGAYTNEIEFRLVLYIWLSE
jgi:hypothetical protein